MTLYPETPVVTRRAGKHSYHPYMRAKNSLSSRLAYLFFPKLSYSESRSSPRSNRRSSSSTRSGIPQPAPLDSSHIYDESPTPLTSGSTAPSQACLTNFCSHPEHSSTLEYQRSPNQLSSQLTIMDEDSFEEENCPIPISSTPDFSSDSPDDEDEDDSISENGSSASSDTSAFDDTSGAHITSVLRPDDRYVPASDHFTDRLHRLLAAVVRKREHEEKLRSGRRDLHGSVLADLLSDDVSVQNGSYSTTPDYSARPSTSQDLWQQHYDYDSDGNTEEYTENHSQTQSPQTRLAAHQRDSCSSTSISSSGTKSNAFYAVSTSYNSLDRSSSSSSTLTSLRSSAAQATFYSASSTQHNSYQTSSTTSSSTSSRSTSCSTSHDDSDYLSHSSKFDSDSENVDTPQAVFTGTQPLSRLWSPSRSLSHGEPRFVDRQPMSRYDFPDDYSFRCVSCSKFHRHLSHSFTIALRSPILPRQWSSHSLRFPWSSPRNVLAHSNLHINRTTTALSLNRIQSKN